MKKYNCIESTLDFTLGDKQFRLWINEDEVESEYPNGDIDGNFQMYVIDNEPTTKQMVEYFVENVPRLNAVQIKNIKTGHGVVVYIVPFEDIKG